MAGGIGGAVRSILFGDADAGGPGMGGVARAALGEFVSGNPNQFRESPVSQEELLEEAAYRFENLGTQRGGEMGRLLRTDPERGLAILRQSGNPLAVFRELQREAINQEIGAMLSGGEPVSEADAFERLSAIGLGDDPERMVKLAKQVASTSGHARVAPADLDLLQQQRDALARKFGEDHPFVRSKDQEISNLIEARSVKDVELDEQRARAERGVRESQPGFRPPEEPLKPKEILDVGKDFRKTKANQDFVEIQNAWRRVVANAADASRDGQPNRIAQQALVVVLNKMLDPGSVVREGEFGRAFVAQGKLEQLKLWIASIERGDQLSPALLADIFETTQNIYEAERGGFDTRREDQRVTMRDAFDVQGKRLDATAPDLRGEFKEDIFGGDDEARAVFSRFAAQRGGDRPTPAQQRSMQGFFEQDLLEPFQR